MRYEIKGRVIDEFTGEGMGGVRVEAWDSDLFFPDDFLNSATTRSDGSFTMTFESTAFQELFLDKSPDLYFKVYCYNELLVSTEGSVMWNVATAHTAVEIKAPHPPTPARVERHIYLKIERLENYSPVKPQDKVVPPIQYGRDCMRNHGHENGLIPQAEIDARALTGVTYREYLDSGYLIPKPDKLIQADVNEPGYMNRIPGTVIYTRPHERLKIHVWNTDDVSHSLHVHGLRYGIDSDGSWPFGTQAAHHGGRSDAICPDGTWIYTYDVPEDALGCWPFHDHTHHMDNKIEQGVFGGIVVLGRCDRPPQRFRYPWWVLEPVFLDVERFEGLRLVTDDQIRKIDAENAAVGHRHDEGDNGSGHQHGEGDAAHGGSGHTHAGEKPDEAGGNRERPTEAAAHLCCLCDQLECGDDRALQLAPNIHARRLKPETRLTLHHHLHFLEEFVIREIALPRPIVNTDHVPVFFHVLANPDAKPVFDTQDIEELGGEAEVEFPEAGDFEYFCTHHPEMTGTVSVVPGGPMAMTVTITGAPPAFSPATVTVGVGGTVTWINNSNFHHTATSKEGAAMDTHCINGRAFIGNSPTIVGRSGQRIRWYVFNLDTRETWHNFHPHAMKWKFGGAAIDIRSMGPAESFVVESEIPPVLLLTDEEEKAQDPAHRPKGATLRNFKGDFMFHCHVHHHMMNGMIGLVRAKQSLWLTDDMAHEISHRTGLPLDDGSNSCPDVDPHPCHHHGTGRWEEIVGPPEVAFMHSVLLPNTQRVLYWGYTRADQSRVWDYSTPAGAYMLPGNQPADSPGLDPNTSDMWSAEHTVLDTAQGTVLIHGGFSPDKAFAFDPAALTWTRVGNTVHNRFYATTLTLANGTAMTLYGNHRSYEIYTHGAGWAAPVPFPASMNHHQYYPWTYLLPDGRLFIAGPHDPSNRIDLAALGAPEVYPTINGDRSTGGEKGSSVMLILRPPNYEPIAYIMGGNLPAAQQTAEKIDLSAAVPAWTALPNLGAARPEQFTATLLPDGRVFIAGGISGGADGGPCEIFDPENPGLGWAMGPAMKYVRTYHSSFLLLPDGSILGGGDPQGGAGPTPHERFFPDYFDMMRPSITAAPAVINYGTTFTITTPNAADIVEVVLLRSGAVTHGFNMSQRGLECVIGARAAGTIDVDMPANPNLAPPGWYLLFVLGPGRVPSQGKWVRVTA